MMIYLYVAFAIVLAFLTLFFGFKAKQAEGVSRMNRIETRYGEGSFAVGIKSSAMWVLWGALCLVTGIGALGMGGLALEKSEQKNGIEKTTSTQASEAKQEVTDQKTEAMVAQAAASQKVEIEKIENAKQKSTVIEAPPYANLPIAPPIVADNGLNSKTTIDTKNKVMAIEVVATNAIQICESASNFFTKNNCRWEQCAKQENENKTECDLFQRKN